VSAEPGDLNDAELARELEQQLAGVSSEDLERMTAVQPHEPQTDESGRVRGRIVEVRGSDVFVDIGGKSEAVVPLHEFDANDPPQSGQMLSFSMHGMDADSGLMRLSLREARPDPDLSSLQVGEVIEARVTGMNIGGLELMTRTLRAFMPKSQIDLLRVEDLTPYIGRRLECEVTEMDRRGKRIVVSRRRVLERQRAEQREQALSELQAGQTRQGVVRRLVDFGAFVDIGGMEGLLHVSDMSYGRVQHPSEIVQEGQPIEVQVLRVDRERNRISLGLKQLEPDPWTLVDANYRPGSTVEGRVVKLMNFGAFVQLEQGVEGLIPVSEMSWTQHVRHPRDLLSEGDTVRVSILNVDPGQRRISLSLKALGPDPWQGIEQRLSADAVVSGAVTRLTDFGAFVQLEEGVEGLVHISEMSHRRVRSPGEVVKEGDVVKVRVKSVDSEQRRIALSIKAASDDGKAEAAERHEGPQRKQPRKRKRPLRGGLD
jgi:small subunit ribosomal protein S1